MNTKPQQNERSRQALHIAHHRPPFIRTGQSIVRWFFRISFMLFWRVRVHGLENYPITDGALVCANHQSNLDPLVLGVVCPRPVNYLGKSTLFHFKPLGWFLNWNDTISLDRSGAAVGGMKETLRRLKRGESVVIFPEGRRSIDGKMQPFMSGFIALARRTSASLVPVGLEGTFAALPPKQSLPRPGRVQVVIGRPIPYDDYRDLDDEGVTKLLEGSIADCFAEAQRRYQSSQPAKNLSPQSQDQQKTILTSGLQATERTPPESR